MQHLVPLFGKTAVCAKEMPHFSLSVMLPGLLVD